MWLTAALLAIATAFLYKNRRYRWFYILSKTYKRDLRAAVGYLRLLFIMWLWERQNKTVPKLFTALTKKHPQKVAFHFEDEAWTFSQAEEFSNRVARHFKNQGFEKGDTIALLLENRHEYPCIWLGLSKIGVVAALINTNLIKDPLIHSIKVANSKALVFGGNHSGPVKDIFASLKGLKLYQFNEGPSAAEEMLPDCIDLRKELGDVSGDQLEKEVELNAKDPLVYIYTSGTTGLPKAAVITNIRFIFMVMAFNCMSGIRQDDIIYNPLPLYHTAGGMVGVGQTFLGGVTMAIRKKFSASNYWKDCAKYKCTVAQYVGEICRYVLAAASGKDPVQHSVRAVFGNGMRPQIWTQFVEKFGIEQVLEFYGATEGISNLINIDNTVGCIGFVPRYCRWLYPVTIIKCDQATGEPIRAQNGLCIQCEIDEPGLIIAKINPKKGAFTFKGYSDQKATEKKILQDVFRPGDMYFNSGDILVCDEFGSFFFKDRTGDTFRWKGENVATSEIEGVISTVVHLNDAVVYGVEVPETEGKAGMAAIVDTNKSLNIDTLCEGLKANLPSYAVPIFVRVMEAVPMTGTYKLKKIELQAEGYDVNSIKDNMYFYNSKLGKYVDLTKGLYEQIMTGRITP